MFTDLLKFITEHTGVKTKDIVNASDWEEFDFNLDKREFDKEKSNTKKTLGGDTKHLGAHKKTGSKI